MGALRVCRILSHPNPTSRKRKGYYPHFTVEETRARGDQVLTWPRSHRELFYSPVCLTSFDVKLKSPQCCAWEGDLPPSSGLGWAPFSQRDPPPPPDRSPRRSSLFLLSWMVCPSLAPFGQTSLSTAPHHRDLSGPHSQKVRRDGRSTVAMLRHPSHTPQF